MSKRLAVILNCFFFTSKFFWVKMQKSTFFKKKKMFLRVVVFFFFFFFFFYKIDVYVVTNWSVRLEKHQLIEILLMVDFLRIFKILKFSNFLKICEIHQYFLVKLLNALNFI